MGEQMIELKDLEFAGKNMQDSPLIRTPLIALNMNTPGKKIYLKCENLQKFGSFKGRGAYHAITQLTEEQRAGGICGASAGNFAQGLGFMANQLNVSCQMLVPDYIPQTKLSRILELDVKIKKVPFTQWWDAILSRTYDGIGQSTFIHPCDYNVMAGHGTIGLEILEDLPDVDTVICPYGSGGLITGVSSALKHHNKSIKVLACEPETATPLHVSLKAGKPLAFENHRSSFVDGMGGKNVLEEIWPYVSHLVDSSIVLSLEEIAEAIRILINRNSLVTEGAGAAPLAAALSNKVPNGTIVCVLSGGNIDSNKLVTILNGQVPT